jgi:4-hydroxymandelate synthase
MTVDRIAYTELYVDDDADVVDYFGSAFGFVTAAVSTGPEHRSTMLRQGDVTLVVTAGPIASAFLAAHGDGVGDLALQCNEPDAARERAIAAGARPLADGRVAGRGGLTHTLVGRPAPGTSPAPPDREWRTLRAAPSTPGHITMLDHVAVCVEAGTLQAMADFYTEAFGLHRYSSEYIQVGEQAMDSVVVRSAGGGVTFTVLAPDPHRNTGQIDAFLERNGGAGVQHLAFGVDDVVYAVRDYRDRGVRFLTTPAAYYDRLGAVMSDMREAIGDLRDTGVLADRDEWGYLLQLFTASPHERNTLFYELVQRRGARGFGTANIRALYEAVERERLATG